MPKYVMSSKNDLPDRTWPSKIIEKAPIWCNVDLRDGNQALVHPMNPSSKLTWFDTLTSIGFKEIEIGFPSASQQDFDFTRLLINENRIPGDITIQVLTQAREHLITRTFEALFGVERAIIHMYNSTSPVQRHMVFGKTKDEIIDIAVKGVKQIRSLAQKSGSYIILEYSPESFSQTELPFAAEICHAVVEAWNLLPDEQMIINLPSTVEVCSPHVYADQIEFMCRQFTHRKNVIISVHTHNDRGCAVAAAELAQCAGAVRVEGTIFGNGERTGNADLVTLALNCFTQGIDPGLDFSDIDAVCRQFTKCTGMSVPVRQPYAGDLVFTAFSGSHQDAISKSLTQYAIHGGAWNIPYLPVDPGDVGRNYQSVIRINSQSGKGGAAYVLEKSHALSIPHDLYPELGEAVKAVTSANDSELSSDDIYTVFTSTFCEIPGPFTVLDRERMRLEMHPHDEYGTIVAMIMSPFGTIDIPGNPDSVVENVQHFFDRSGIDVTIKEVKNGKHDLEAKDKTVYIKVCYRSIVTRFGASVESDRVPALVHAACSALNRLNNSVGFCDAKIRPDSYDF